MSRGTGTGRHSGGNSELQLTETAADKPGWNMQPEQSISLRWNECCNNATSTTKVLTTRVTAGLEPWRVIGSTQLC